MNTDKLQDLWTKFYIEGIRSGLRYSIAADAATHGIDEFYSLFEYGTTDSSSSEDNGQPSQSD